MTASITSIKKKKKKKKGRGAAGGEEIFHSDKKYHGFYFK